MQADYIGDMEPEVLELEQALQVCLQLCLFRPMQDTSWDHFRVFSAAIQCAETTQELDSVEVAIKLWRIDGLAWVLGPG